MAIRQFLLPDLGEGLEDAEVVTWRVKEGDRVELNQVLGELNTAKALVEIPSPWEGTIEKLHASEGDVVKVGEPLVSIRIEGDAEEQKSKRTAVLVGYGVEEEEPAAASPTAPTDRRPSRTPVAASPPVRRLAKELGVDLASVTGTGPQGRVTREDVARVAEAAPTREEAPGDERIPVKGVRRLVAEKMARSSREIPHVTTFLTVDASHLEAFRNELKTKVTALPIVVRAFVEIIKEYRSLNASFDPEAHEIVLRGDVHVGIATDTERGLLVPVVRHAHRMGIDELAAEVSRLVQAARAGKSKPEELTGGTVTVTNVGSFGAESGTPIINFPESSILAVGVIEPRALVVDGQVEARPAVTLSLTFDHRVFDGAEAGRALKALGDLLESPFRLGALHR
jgi:2-oxoisovalerate dehydrogenase E2 component (dihydrolipoyl transacylase)